jgi:small multidrug resistance pump
LIFFGIKTSMKAVTKIFMAKFYTLIVTIALFDLLAIFAGKMSIVTGKSIYIGLTSLFFAVAGYFFALSLKYEDVAIVNILWISLSIILVALMGHFIFKEHLSSTDILGMTVVVIGVILLNLK